MQASLYLHSCSSGTSRGAHLPKYPTYHVGNRVTVRAATPVLCWTFTQRHSKHKWLTRRVVFCVLKWGSVAGLQFVVLSWRSNTFWFLSPFSLKEDGAGAPYDKESTAIIKLNNTTVLYLKEVTKFLALVCFVREESFERKGNFWCDLKRTASVCAASVPVEWV